MKIVLNFLKFVACVLISLALMFLFSVIGTLGMVLIYQYISPGWLLIIEILLGVPLLILTAMPVLESAKRLNFLNPYGSIGRKIIALSTMVLCTYLLYSYFNSENMMPLILKINYLIYTVTIYLSFAIYTYNWDKDKVNREWFVFSNR